MRIHLGLTGKQLLEHSLAFIEWKLAKAIKKKLLLMEKRRGKMRMSRSYASWYTARKESQPLVRT